MFILGKKSTFSDIALKCFINFFLIFSIKLAVLFTNDNLWFRKSTLCKRCKKWLKMPQDMVFELFPKNWFRFIWKLSLLKERILAKVSLKPYLQETSGCWVNPLNASVAPIWKLVNWYAMQINRLVSI